MVQRLAGFSRLVARTVLILILTVTIGAPLAATTAAAAYVLLPLPAEPPAMRPAPAVQPSVVYASDGTVIGEFREAESREPVPADQIPDTIKRAVVAAEDHTFYDHSGIDWKALARAAWTNYRTGEYEQGGSTITQQLVKNRYTDGRRTIRRKLHEAFISIQLERALDKDEILARYLNTVYFGDSVYGVAAAARSYFRKPLRELSLSEAALLAGIIPAPSRYSPRSHPETAERKRKLVLDALERHGLATPEEVAAARAARPTVHPPPVVQSPYPYFLDYVRHYLLNVKRYPAELVYGGGLRIETALDRRLQDHAAAAIRRILNRDGDPESSLVAVEPGTGFVRALIGGRDWARSKVNLALGRLGGGTGRQAGSAFKPFVLARALDAGMSPLRTYPAPARIQPPGFDQPVRNYGLASYGKADLAMATRKSINTVYAQLIADVGVRETAEMARRLGVTSIDPSQPLYPSIALGSQEVSPLEMASAYSVFAARGVAADPTPVRRIARRGQAIEDNEVPAPGETVLPEPVADTVNQILQGVITSGTGSRADIGLPAAGKTGTSQNYGNAWFVGYTPRLSTAVWVGHPEGNIPMLGVHGVRAVAGGTIPAQIWHDVMAVALKHVPPVDFFAPRSLGTIAERQRRAERGGIDPGAGRAATEVIPAGPRYYTAPPLPKVVAPSPDATDRPRPVPSPSPRPAPEAPPESTPATTAPPPANSDISGAQPDAGGKQGVQELEDGTGVPGPDEPPDSTPESGFSDEQSDSEAPGTETREDLKPYELAPAGTMTERQGVVLSPRNDDVTLTRGADDHPPGATGTSAGAVDDEAAVGPIAARLHLRPHWMVHTRSRRLPDVDDPADGDEHVGPVGDEPDSRHVVATVRDELTVVDA